MTKNYKRKDILMKEVKRNYKDGIFRMLFDNEDKIRELYNAISGSNYSKDVEVEIVTLKDVIVGDLKNDLAFIIDGKLIVLIEHQATLNPNMPLRMLCYLAKEYEKKYFKRSGSIYSNRQLKIPTPELYVFYNGDERLNKTKLKLSDAYLKKCDKLSVEVVVEVIDVNYEKGEELVKRSETLAGYSYLVHLIREKKNAGIDEDRIAEDVIKECMSQGILVDFLHRYGGEIVSFLCDELTREECLAIRAQEGYELGLERGIEQGLEQGIQQGLEQGLERGLEQGLEQGLQQGLQEGLAKGLAEGLEQGVLEEKYNTARLMKNSGELTEKIALYTGLDVKEIEKI